MKKNKQYFFANIKNALLFIAAVFLIYSLSKNIFGYQKKILFFQNYQKELQQEKEKNKQLKSNIVKSYDYYTVEKNIRQKLNLLQPDEIAVIIPKVSPTPMPYPTPAQSIPAQWWNLFFKKI